VAVSAAALCGVVVLVILGWRKRRKEEQ